jgi:tetratricopeptide (TPR) repeat protein
MKKIVVALLFILLIIHLPAQSTYIDSLQKALALSKADTNRVLILQDLTLVYAYESLDSGLIYAERTSIQVKSKWLGVCYATLCVNYTYLKILDSALAFGLKSDALIPWNEFNISSVADIYLRIHKVAEAEKFFNRVIDIYHNNGDISQHSFNFLSKFYQQKNLIDSAICFARKHYPKVRTKNLRT